MDDLLFAIFEGLTYSLALDCILTHNSTVCQELGGLGGEDKRIDYRKSNTEKGNSQIHKKFFKNPIDIL
jgi:hypothetical protein